MMMKSIEPFIIEIRKQKVILDSHVAKIYGVETRAINQAVQRNLDKFPKGYIFQLNKKEREKAITNCDVLQDDLKFSSKLPKAFTEKDLYMLATILKSKQATKATLQIIETFSKVREFSKVTKKLATEKDEKQKKTLVKKSGELIGEILNQEFADSDSSETTIELNLAMIKIKHKITKKKK